MTQIINPERLRLVRKIRSLSRAALAGKAGLTAKTVYRLEKGDEAKPIRQANLERLAKTLDIDPGVLTGDEPMPSVADQLDTVVEEAAYQLNVRVDAAVRNAFVLVARRYKVSTTKVAQLAPLLFTIVAEASLKHRDKKLDELEAMQASLSELEAKLPHLPVWRLQCDPDLEPAIREERASIRSRDLFGSQLAFDDWGGVNPFEAYLKALTAGADDDITISAVGEAATDYRVCRSEAVKLAGGEFADSLLDGEVPIHRMPRGLKTYDEFMEWVRENKISVRKLDEKGLMDAPEGPWNRSAIDIEIEL